MALAHSFLCYMISHAHALYSLVTIPGAIGRSSYAACFGRTLLSRIVVFASVVAMEAETREGMGEALRSHVREKRSVWKKISLG